MVLALAVVLALALALALAQWRRHLQASLRQNSDAGPGCWSQAAGCNTHRRG
jgi:hypothetical protein